MQRSSLDTGQADVEEVSAFGSPLPADSFQLKMQHTVTKHTCTHIYIHTHEHVHTQASTHTEVFEI